ncbi:MAG TPA: response regulator, partial [Stellaceae bacterium]|nr:response regulator [Stellaceae bacterium]
AFDPFFTTKPVGKGTGLGLSMIYGFAKQSNGQVRICSEVGKGTTVKLYLPRHAGEVPEDVDDDGRPALPNDGAGETVLVVDDEPTVRMLIHDVLEELGYRTIEAADAASALKVLESDIGIDLLITDIGLPGGMNGIQMAEAVRERRPDQKILFITGFAETAAAGDRHIEPGTHLLKKPFAVENLASRVRAIIVGR